MNWIKCKKSEINNLYCVDNLREDWRVMFSVRDYTPTEEESQREDAPDCECLCSAIKGNPSDWDIKQAVIKAQREYDASDEVNCFYVNGKKAWMDKATRVGLVNSMSVLEAAGKTTYTVWFDNTPYTADINIFKNLIATVELYAMECYAVTERHLVEINNLNTKEDCFNYDISAGYPEKMRFDIPAE